MRRYQAQRLISGLCQGYKTIADFRKNNKGAFRKILRSFILLLKDWNLVDGSSIAIDSFKIRAQNSLKNKLNQAKIDLHTDYYRQPQQITEHQFGTLKRYSDARKSSSLERSCIHVYNL